MSNLGLLEITEWEPLPWTYGISLGLKMPYGEIDFH